MVRVKVLKAIGSLTKDSPLFAGYPSGESTIDASLMNIYNGNIFVNNNLRIRYGSEVNVYDDKDTEKREGKVLVVQNLILTASTLNSSSRCAKNVCNTTSTCQCDPDPEDIFEKCEGDSCPPNSSEMPMVDSDSDDPNS